MLFMGRAARLLQDSFSLPSSVEGSLLLSIYSTRFHYAFYYYSIDSVEDHYKMPRETGSSYV
jgi:hypothetical protein